MLSFHHVPEAAAAIDNLSQHLLERLQAGQKVLWLIGGGSNIAMSVEVMRVLPPEAAELLTIMLTDERYGSFDHADSNMRQLSEAGFMPGRSRVIPVLREEELALAETVQRYAGDLEAALQAADAVVAQFGIGPDGHIAGMLPHSPAVSETGLVSGYDAGAFVRITITPPAIRRIDAAFAYAFGLPKHETLQRLQTETLPLDEQPAQILKELPEAHLYSDQVADQQTAV